MHPKPLRRAHLNLPRQDGHAIVAPMHYNSAGIYYEQDEVLLVPDWRRGEVLAAALRAALDRFSFREADLRERKQSDWPSFRASSCRSIREFRRVHLFIAVQAISETEFFYDARAQPSGESDLELHASLNPYRSDDEMQRLLLRLFDGCERWTEFLAAR